VNEGADPTEDIARTMTVLDDPSERLPHLLGSGARLPSQRSAAWVLVIVAASGWFTVVAAIQ
jgi:hypothetical protein